MHFLGPAHHDVPQGGHAPKKRQVLKCPGNAHGCHLVGLDFLRPLDTLEKNTPLVGCIDPVDDVQHGHIIPILREYSLQEKEIAK